jgi:hypothetical protein
MRFIAFIAEQKIKNPVVFAFGRMNPPTTGHAALVDKVKEIARENNAKHEIVLSHTQDKKKNPLSAEQKLQHAKRFFPDTNITVASKEQPTLMHHLSRLHQEGHDHAIVVAGSDRVDEYRKLIDQYNGKPDKKGNVPFSFKKVDVVSSGDRDPDAEGVSGMSASKMREHALTNNFEEFRKGVPSHVSDAHAKKLFNDVKQGMA